jgi:hypothetical protein
VKNKKILLFKKMLNNNIYSFMEIYTRNINHLIIDTIEKHLREHNIKIFNLETSLLNAEILPNDMIFLKLINNINLKKGQTIELDTSIKIVLNSGFYFLVHHNSCKDNQYFKIENTIIERNKMIITVTMYEDLAKDFEFKFIVEPLIF